MGMSRACLVAFLLLDCATPKPSRVRDSPVTAAQLSAQFPECEGLAMVGWGNMGPDGCNDKVCGFYELPDGGLAFCRMTTLPLGAF